MQTTFGPVLVASKKLVPSGVHYAVTLLQEEHRQDYSPSDVLAGKTTQLPPTSTRKVSIRVIPEVAAHYVPGQVVEGHIQRVLYPHPRYKGQKESFSGGYPQAKWVEAYTPDQDLRGAQ